MVKLWERVRSLVTSTVAVSLLFACSSDPPQQAKDGEQQAQALEVEAPETQTVWVMMKDQADLKSVAAIKDWSQRGREVVSRLTATAQRSQAGVHSVLASTNATSTSYWIVNAMQVTADKATIARLENHPDVAGVYPDRVYELPPVKVGTDEPTINAVEWGVNAVRAPQVWSTFSSRGEGIVVANIDTGVQFDHPALARQYRGNEGGVINHNYNWFDPAAICPVGTPCDNNNHGTHTMGTMVGEDASGVNQIGVAPGARWIAAKGCEASSCSRSSLLAAGQWILAPTDLSGANPRPDLRPNIVNNSWGGGGGDAWYRATVQAWVAAGIFPSFSNGNSGSGCGTSGSPGDYDESYSVGAFASDGSIASFSSRGPGLGGNMKPNIAAPGVNVRSSVQNGGYLSLQGTSMAAPHLSGVVALMWSAAPSLVGNIALTESLLDQTAVDTNDITCGGTAQDNNVWGEGKVDAYVAVDQSPRGPTGTLAGLVHTSEGAPITSATVSVSGPSSRSTATNAAGNFNLTLPVGSYAVTASAYGYLPETLDAQEITAGNTTTLDLELEAAPAFSLSGTVTAAGQPVVGANVVLSGSPLSTVTDASGNYSLPVVLAGNYDLVVSGASRCVGGETRAISITENTVANFALQPRRDSFGYGCRSIPFEFVDGTTRLTLSGDDSSTSVALPFAFPYYGGSYSTAFVSTNGHVNFSAANATYSNTSLPNPSTPNLAIYGFWDDLMIDSTAGVWTATVGTAPNRTFVIEYRNVAFYSATGRIDFELLLGEDGTIGMLYKALDNSSEQGVSATVGLENLAGNVAFQYSYNEAVLSSNLAVEYGLAADDTEPPTVALTAPSDGSVLTGLVALSATATDDVGVERVEFYLDAGSATERLLGSDSSAPYEASWNTVLESAGAHTLTARAFDLAGNESSSAVVNVTLDNPPDTEPPSAVITSPDDGDLVGGNVSVSVVASDNLGVASVTLLVDGSPLATDSTAPYVFTWDSRVATDGPHELVAVATDLAGNSTESSVVALMTDNTDPELELTAPSAGAVLTGTTEFSATAADPSGIDRVNFLVDGVLLGSDSSEPYTWSWDSTGAADGSHEVLAVAVDGVGNAVSAGVNVIVDNDAPLVSITAPAAGSTVSGTVNITADATDAGSGVEQVQFLVDGVALSTDTSAPFAASWSATVPGAHTLTAIARDRAGNLQTSTAVSVNVPQPFQFFWFEAEAGSPTSPLRSTNDATASAGRYMDVTPGNNSANSAPTNGRATYNFNVTQAGTYRVWGRVIAPTLDDDSFWFQMDSGTWQKWNTIPQATSWAWDDVHHENNGSITALTFNLPVGSHRITLAYREDGTRIDRLLVTNDLSFVPSGMGPGTPPATPSGLTATAGAGQIALSWSASAGATSYIVKRGNSGGPYSQVAAPTLANHTDAGLTNGAQYCYVVAAVNSNGTSADSAQVCATPNGCTSNAQCSDGQYCNGAETCSNGSCLPGTAPNCADAVGCTVDACNEATDSCTHTADNAACNDGTFCNGAETCNVTNGCQAGTPPCEGSTCDEAGDRCGGGCSSNSQCDDGQYCNGQETCGAGGVCQPGQDQGQACYNARSLSRNQQSGSFNTTGEVWYVITENPNGWQASQVQGRTIFVNGVQVSPGQMPLPPAINGRRYFRFTAGGVSWASWSFW